MNDAKTLLDILPVDIKTTTKHESFMSDTIICKSCRCLHLYPSHITVREVSYQSQINSAA